MSEDIYSPWRQMESTSVYELNIALKTEKLAKITGLTLFLLLIFRASVMIWRPDCQPKHDLSWEPNTVCEEQSLTSVGKSPTRQHGSVIRAGMWQPSVSRVLCWEVGQAADKPSGLFMKYSPAVATKVKSREPSYWGGGRRGEGRPFATDAATYAKRSLTIAPSPSTSLITIGKAVSDAKHLG